MGHYQSYNDKLPQEVALLRPNGSEGTEVCLASEKEDIRLLLEGGMTMAEAVLPLTAPATVDQLVSIK